MIFPDPKDIVDGEEVTNPTTGVIYVYEEATNSWNVKASDPVDTGDYATIVYSDAEDAKLKALIDANTAQIEEWANSISSGSYTWAADAVAVGDVASIPSTQGNWSVVTKIAIEPTPIGIGGVSVANMSIGDVISFTSPSDDDYATFEITDTDSANSTIDVTVIDSEGGPAYGTTVMVKHYPQIDTSNFVTNVEFNAAVNDLQGQIDGIETGADVDHTHPEYSQTTHTHPYSPLSHNHSGEYAEVQHPHDDLKQGIEDLTNSVAELNKSKPNIFKYQASLPLVDGDFTILGEDGLSVGNLSDGKSIIWNTSKTEVQDFVGAGYSEQTLKMTQVGSTTDWMAAEITNVAQSGDWSIEPFFSQGSATGDAEYIFELLPPGGAGDYINAGEDTDIKPTADNRFVTLRTRRPQEADGSYADEEFGLEISIDEGNTYKNQFVVSSKDGYALKVLGGTGKTTWIGGKIVQQGNSLENPDDRDYIIRKNLTDAVVPLLGQIETNEDRINALEAELEAVADTKETGEWELVAPLDFDVRGSGQMTLANDDFTASNNEMTLHATDKNGLSHGFSGVEVGDLVEVVEENIARSTGDYGLYEVTGVNGMSFTLSLQQGRGTALTNKNFFVKFFHLSDNIDLAELDARYAQKTHSHSYANTNHTHSGYSSTGHTHGGYAETDHRHDGLGLKGADFDYDWNQYHSTTYSGNQIHRKSSFPSSNGDWSAESFDNNYLGNLAYIDQIGRLAVMPPYGVQDWEAGYLGYIWFGEGEYSTKPIAIFEIIDRERSTNYFRWYVRLLWQKSALKVQDLDGKMWKLNGGAVTLKR
jgi:hypothetical protein